MKKIMDYVWPCVGLVAVVLSVQTLYEKLHSEAATDEAVREALEKSGLWDSIGIIAHVIGAKLGAIPTQGYVLAVFSTLAAYAALA